MDFLKKNLLSIVGVLAVVGVVATIMHDRGFLSLAQGETDPSSQISAIDAAIDSMLVEPDSDDDGLPDWKEALYHSDIGNVDTDGDGTKDGDEIMAGRDPSKAGPDDTLSYLAQIPEATSSSDMIGIKREFFAKYLKKESKNIQEETVKELVRKFDPSTYAPHYKITDIKTTSDVSTSSLLAYGNAFGAVIKKYLAQQNRSEDGIIDEATKGGNKDALRQLEFSAVVYRNFVQDLMAIPAPLPLAENHLLIINGYDVMSRGLLGMEKMYDDPVEGTGAYQAYTRYRFDVTTGYAKTVAYLIDNKIEFAQNDPGAPFTWAPIMKGNQQLQWKSLPKE